MSATEPLLKCEGLVAGYGGPAIVRNVDLAIPANEMMTLVGPNGAGKSTLLRAFYGLTKTYSGRILFESRTIEKTSPLERYASGVAFVPQGRCNFDRMSVAENLAVAAHSVPVAKRAEALDYVLGLFPTLKPLMSSMAGNLSGGEQQLLEMAMVLQTRPKCLLVDEPSLGLSPRMQVSVFEKLADLRSAGMTVVAVEQNVRVALAVSDRAAVLVHGEIAFEGPAGEILADDRIRSAYLGGQPIAAAH
ncbi:ABC transporter ATP-binding protein [Mesorhizobium australicum]|uniref:Amino acid/amide ABC transporter ATP-binding protein 2, HAAT family n=1 Tax=Mesorhizobium australicum TaxID=536018 RepID=A0A1X7NFS8_9HYPH|nr:ABC transporter ATP-binding protein [Mesorhizobium australicum]SMH36561.1 amino acid/amide ABC transporter ATP-binding protein 2, HAAT family [Mesorhizobium australicum]